MLTQRSHCSRQQGCPCGDLPPSALEGGAHDSGRAWSSQGLLVDVHTWSSAARDAACKLHIINYLTKIRVMVFTTLKMAKALIVSEIHIARPWGVTLETLTRVATGTDTVMQT